MKNLEYEGYFGTIEFSKADNIYFGQVLGVQGLISYEGDNLESLEADFQDAIDDYLEMCEEDTEQKYNKETENAIQEARDIASGKQEAKSYTSLSELLIDTEGQLDDIRVGRSRVYSSEEVETLLNKEE